MRTSPIQKIGLVMIFEAIEVKKLKIERMLCQLCHSILNFTLQRFDSELSGYLPKKIQHIKSQELSSTKQFPMTCRLYVMYDNDLARSLNLLTAIRPNVSIGPGIRNIIFTHIAGPKF